MEYIKHHKYHIFYDNRKTLFYNQDYYLVKASGYQDYGTTHKRYLYFKYDANNNPIYMHQILWNVHEKQCHTRWCKLQYDENHQVKEYDDDSANFWYSKISIPPTEYTRIKFFFQIVFYLPHSHNEEHLIKKLVKEWVGYSHIEGIIATRKKIYEQYQDLIFPVTNQSRWGK